MSCFGKRNLRVLLVALQACILLLVFVSSSSGFEKDQYAKQLARAEKALKSGDFTRAEQIYRDILSKDEHHVEARLGLSRALLKERRLQDAFDHAARVIAVEPLSARGHALLGATVLASGDFRLSVEEFRTALSLNENEAIAIAGLAIIV